MSLILRIIYFNETSALGKLNVNLSYASNQKPVDYYVVYTVKKVGISPIVQFNRLRTLFNA